MEIVKNIKYFSPLIILLVIDLILIVLNIKNSGQSLGSIELRQAESLQKYFTLKWMLMLMATALIALSTREKKYFTWILALAFLFIESTNSIHQYLGTFFYNVFGMTTGQQGKNIMNLFGIIFLSFIFLAPAFEAHKRGSQLFQKLSKFFLILLVILLIFVIVVGQNEMLSASGIQIDLVAEYGQFFMATLLAGYLLSLVMRSLLRKDLI